MVDVRHFAFRYDGSDIVNWTVAGASADCARTRHFTSLIRLMIPETAFW